MSPLEISTPSLLGFMSPEEGWRPQGQLEALPSDSEEERAGKC